jgi:hypothetical protein
MRGLRPKKARVGRLFVIDEARKQLTLVAGFRQQMLLQVFDEACEHIRPRNDNRRRQLIDLAQHTGRGRVLRQARIGIGIDQVDSAGDNRIDLPLPGAHVADLGEEILD